MNRLRTGFRQPIAVRYGFAVLVAVAALLIRVALSPVVGTTLPYTTFFLAVAASAAFGGILPGVVTLGLGGLFAGMFLLASGAHFQWTDPGDTPNFLRYLTASVVLCLISGVAARSRERARAAEQAEREARHFFEQTLEAISDAVIAVDVYGRVLFLNEVAARLTGWLRYEALGEQLGEVFRLVDGESGARLPGVCERVLAERHEVRLPEEVRLETRRGGLLMIEGAVTPMAEGSPARGGAVLVFRDVSERRIAEAKRRTNEARLELAVRSARMVVWELDPATGRVAATGDVPGIFGRSMDTQADFLEVIHPEDEEGVRSRLQRLVEEGGEFRADFRVVRPDNGEEVWLEDNVHAVRDGAGRIVRVVGVVVDVTERKNSERALRETAQIYRAIGESIPFGVWVCDADGRNFYTSESFLNLVGITQEDCSEFGWGETLHPDDRERTIARWKECVQTGGVWDIEHRFLGVDGQYHPILARGVPVKDDAGRTVCWAGINLDLSRIKDVEEALRRQAEELKRSNRELEQFAFVASHDLQEPLRMVNAYTELLLRRIGDRRTEEMNQYAGFIEQAVRKMEQLIRDLLSFSRVIHGETAVKPVDANVVLEHTLISCRRLIAESGAVVTFDPLPAVLTDESQLAQVFQNLVSNAVKYAKPGEAPRIHIGAAVDGTEAVFRVRDYGMGFDPRYSEAIFRLFKRLHGSEYPGTGLGLAICQRIVERYGGKIRAESVPGEGATFSFSLPLSG